MVEAATYISHMSVGNQLEETACGEPWQGWQSPENYRGDTIPPNDPPKHLSKIRLCQACQNISVKGKYGALEN